MDESYEDPRFASDQGRYVSTGGDAGGYWEPLTVATPLGQYVGSGDAGGQWQEFSPEQRTAEAARIEADRLSRLGMASDILAENPLSVTGNRIQTRFGDRDVSLFNPIVAAGVPVTGETAAQLVDPQTGSPVFLRDPNDPFSYTYDDTGTPAISGTVAQQAALYRPIEDKGVFGTLGGDLLSAVKDPYFHKFAAAAAAMAGAAALAPASGAVGGAQAFPVNLGSTITTGGAGGQFASTLSGLGATGAEAAAGLGSVGGALGAGGTGLTGATSLGAALKSIAASPAFQIGRVALPVVGALTAGSRSSNQGNQVASGGGGGGQGYTKGPWNTFMDPTMTRQEGSGTTVMQNPQLAMLSDQLVPELSNQLAQSGSIPSNLAGSNVPSVNYYSYGSVPQTEFFPSYDSPLMAANGGSIKKPQKLAMGGLPMPASADDEHIPEFITGATGHYVKGRGDGQSDDIPAMLADGEYVFDADTVAQLGNGSSDAGAKFLDSFRHAVREHKRSAPVDKIPPKASPLQYVKEAMKRTS